MTAHALSANTRSPIETAEAAASVASHKTPPTGFLDIEGGRIAYDDVGTGPLVVLLPSLGDIRQEYRFLRPRLVAAGFRVVTMDLRGHGDSSTGWSDHTGSAMGADVLALVASLNAGPASLIGTSMGAAAVAWAAAEAPELIDGLVLVDPFVRANPPVSGMTAILMKLVMAVAFNGPWRVWAWTKYYDSLYPTRKPADHAEYLTSLRANLSEAGRFAATKAMLAASKADVEPRLAAIRARTLIVMGSKDPDFPDPQCEAKLVSNLVGGAPVQMIEDAGHYPHAEMPDETAEAIVAHLRGAT